MNKYCAYTIWSNGKYQKLLLKFNKLIPDKNGNHIIIVNKIIYKKGENLAEIGINLNLYRIPPLGWCPFRYNEKWDYIFEAVDDESAKLIFEVSDE